MKEQLQKRLQDLKAEYKTGQEMLADLEARQANLRETLLRISGAVQVIEELLEEPSESEVNGDRSTELAESVEVS